jgi:hypothetical protein
MVIPVTLGGFMRRFSTILLCAISIVILRDVALACSCLPAQPLCQAYANSPAVFVGLVTEVKTSPDSDMFHRKVVKFAVDEALKGVSEKTIEVTTADNTAACGYPFEQGKKYLVYTQAQALRLTVSICSRTRLLEEGGSDLTFMRGLSPSLRQDLKSFMMPPLTAGWNLISLPLHPANISAEHVLSEISSRYVGVWAYENGAYKKFNPASPSTSTMLTMEEGKGYWIYMREAGAFSVCGTTAKDGIELKRGWQLVGYNDTQKREVKDALLSINGKYFGIYAWDNTAAVYHSYVPSRGGTNSLSAMEPGFGYWLYSTEDAHWTLQSPGVKVGRWGGTHIDMQVTAAGATIEYDCASGTVDERMVLDSKGNFDVRGTHTPRQGGPVRPGDTQKRRPARYKGWTDGANMTLAVILTDTNETLGTFTLGLNKQAQIVRCL